MKPAGQRDTRVRVMRKEATRSPSGAEVETWVLFAERWAAVAPLSGKEFLAADQVQSSVDYRVNLLLPLAITQHMRIEATVHGVPLVLDIVALIPSRDEVEVMCATGVRNAR